MVIIVGRTRFFTAASRLLLVAVAVAAWAVAGRAAGFEAVGTILGVDAERGRLQIQANGRDRDVAIAPDVRTLDADGKPLGGGLKSAELKAGAQVTVTVEPGAAGSPEIRAIRLGRHAGGGAPAPAPAGRASVGLKPLSEMSAEDRYKGEDGGLYGGGRNDPPEALLAAARMQAARIVPLDADGRPAKNGTIGLISISMSNATQEYSLFKRLADADPAKSHRVVVVDCAQGGQAMAEWAPPDARPWTEAERRLQAAGVGARQVQVAWVKLANKGPRGELAEHGEQLRKDTLAVLQNARTRFPNLRVAYLGSRIYAGYATTPLNPEPYAYESAFVARWLIRAQMKGDAGLRWDDAAGPAKAPLLLWGPYFWGDGTTPRKGDGLVWERADLGPDGTHPSDSGRRKVAEMLLKFFKEDPLAAGWFVREPDKAGP